MTTSGQLKAKPPISPHATLRAVERIGTTKAESAVWRIECTCGSTFTAVAHGFRIGQTKCARCQPCAGDINAIEILMLLPNTMDVIWKKLGVPPETLKGRIVAMKKNGYCHTGRWRRPNGPGSFQPLIVAGPGEDAPCKLVAGTNLQHKRKYRKRIKKAVERFESNGSVDPRYSRHIGLHTANQTVQRTLVEPQHVFSALFVGVRASVNGEG